MPTVPDTGGVGSIANHDPERARPGAVLTLMGVMLGMVVLVGIVAVREWPDAISTLINQATTIERALGAAGWVLAALVQVVIALCGILPASVGGLAAGMLYGVVGGFCVSTFGTLIGAALAFGLTRTLFRPVIARMLARRPRFQRLDQAVARDGWRLVCLLRISPVMPFAVTSYALGLSSLDFRSYAIGTLASLPALLGYVVLGHLSGNGLSALAAHQTGWLHWCLLGLTIGATALLTLKIGGLLRQALRLPEAPLA